MTISIRDILSDERRQMFDYEGGNAVIYLGKAHPGAQTSEAVWQIRQFTYSGSLVTQINFANGNANFDKVWDDRSTYDFDPDS